MPGTYMTSLLNGAANDVPILTGNTIDESGATYNYSTTVAAYLEALEEQYGNWTEKFLALYPANNDTQAAESSNAHYRDTSITGSWLWANRYQETESSDVYTYIWDHAPPGQDQGAYHELEINYVLNNLYGTDLPWTAEDYAIAQKMNSYRANFAKTGNPNLGGSYPA